MLKNVIKYKVAKKVIAPVAGDGILSTAVAVKAVKEVINDQPLDEAPKNKGCFTNKRRITFFCHAFPIVGMQKEFGPKG